MPLIPDKSPSFFTRYQFWFLLVLACFCRNLPIVSIPFNWLESYFHEISHGIAAILTGGEILRIQLFLNGAGLCTSQGGVRFVTSFMGYAGASLWGALIYALASMNQKLTRVISSVIIGLLLLSCVLWTKDLLTLIILITLVLLFSFKLTLSDNRFAQKALQLIGLTVLLNAFMSPFYLLDGRALGDGASLAELTFIPEIVWVLIWSAFSGVLLFKLASLHKSKKEKHTNAQ